MNILFYIVAKKTDQMSKAITILLAKLHIMGCMTERRYKLFRKKRHNFKRDDKEAGWSNKM